MSAKTLTIPEDALVNILKTLPEDELMDIFHKTDIESDTSPLSRSEKAEIKSARKELAQKETISGREGDVYK
jgi:hypothetical protein